MWVGSFINFFGVYREGGRGGGGFFGMAFYFFFFFFLDGAVKTR